jgi:glycosyltransferase involved in cell wall biosynthesis
MLVVNSRFLTQNLTGVQRFAIEISFRLKELLKDEIVFVAPNNIIQKDVAEHLGVKVIGVHLGHIWEQWDLPKWLRKNGNPLLLNLCNMAPVMYKNKISTVHDIAFVRYPQTFSKQFLAVYRFMIPWIISSSKKVLTVSEFSKQEIIEKYGIEQNKILVVYNAVNKKFMPIIKC